MNEGGRLQLPQVTLCAVTSVNVAATMQALEMSLAQVDFGACRFLTDAPVRSHHALIEMVPITRIASAARYSDFLLTELADHVQTSHCLVAQWDGHVLNASRWRAEFLDYDYVGASWPQFQDGNDVGNGGFSLRSKRLMELCRHPDFAPCHPEDIAIGRANRAWLEAKGMRFAPRDLADLFSAERTGDLRVSFGYHGVWNMPRAIGVQAFWSIYKEMDDLGTLRRDFTSLLRDVWRGPRGKRRALQMVLGRMTGHF